MCFVWMSEQTACFSLYIINRLVFETEVESAVHTHSLYNTEMSRLPRVKGRFLLAELFSMFHERKVPFHRLSESC